MKYMLLLLSLGCITSSIAQGYKKITIHKTDGDVILCYVKNFRVDKKPEPLWYSFEKGGKVEIMSLASIAKIQHKGQIFIFTKVEFDNTTTDINKLEGLGKRSWNRFFFLEESALYLQLLVDGEIPLYKSFFNGITKFFIENKDGVIIPLLYKKYFIPRPLDHIGPNFAKENNFYQQQLLNEAPCQDLNGKMDFPDYSEFGLINYFKRVKEGKCN